jgi:hypothetical protein
MMTRNGKAISKVMEWGMILKMIRDKNVTWGTVMRVMSLFLCILTVMAYCANTTPLTKEDDTISILIGIISNIGWIYSHVSQLGLTLPHGHESTDILGNLMLQSITIAVTAIVSVQDFHHANP